MSIELIYKILENQPELTALLDGLNKAGSYNKKAGLLQAAKPVLISWLSHQSNSPILFIAASQESAHQLYYDIQNWVSESNDLYLLPEILNPDSDTQSFNTDEISTRLRILEMLDEYNTKSGNPDNKPVVIASALAVCQKVSSVSEFRKSSNLLTVNMHADPDDIVKKWNSAGYENEAIVELPGTYCKRGGILDIYPLNYEYPVRIEFSGSSIASIRTFDARSQKSIRKLESILIVAASNKPRTGDANTILDYLPASSLVIMDSSVEIEHSLNDYMEHSGRENGQDNDDNIAIESHYIAPEQFQEKISRIKKKLEFGFISEAGGNDVVLPFSIISKFGGRLENFIRDLQDKLGSGCKVVIMSQQIARLQELLADRDIILTGGSQHSRASDTERVIFIKGSPAEGWIIPGNAIIYTDNEIFGFIKQPRLQKRRPVKHHLYLDQLQVGDFVVHIDHGIGKFIGLTRFESSGNLNEYIVLEYASGDKLYVPTSQTDRVSRYVGGTDKRPSLTRLNTQEWALVKARVKKAIRNIAEELLKLYAARQLSEGFAFSADTVWQRELESSFPYEETEDQMEALEAVKSDMESPKPMDRLICGDVGYGKTEIALRAAFKAVMDNKQVAILVPTTVLAQQHYLTFCERLSAFPVEVKVLSRFCSDREQSDIIGGLSSGNVDICIGTHRLLQKDILFKDLGLLIIDEEQRFGVVHKEYFKKMRREIDILTLTATPIPRTLHMSLSGIKDLSTLETPPEERLPIKTAVVHYNAAIIREAILNEVRRGGQVFYVHNRIYDIFSVARKLAEILPGIRIGVAHGRMAEEELEKIMLDFVEHKSDVLLTTTIIESGIDIPNANTLLIDDSDRFGLVQLHQLRGRIGRGSYDAYSYLFYRPDKKLTEEAKKRLRTISEATELGAGFTIAMKDLEIRGAGNLLGTEQSGYISAIGFDLYTRLLAEAIEELKANDDLIKKHGTALQGQHEITISLGLDAYIPDDYIPMADVRIEFYKRISGALAEQDVTIIEEELIDRFGEIPSELSNLFYIVKLKQLCKHTGIEGIGKLDGKIVVSFRSSGRLLNKNVDDLMIKYENALKKGTRQLSIDLKNARDNWQVILVEIIRSLNERE
jgi:transcription-repair coupling factor (superfamily II helicase)